MLSMICCSLDALRIAGFFLHCSKTVDESAFQENLSSPVCSEALLLVCRALNIISHTCPM